MKTFVKALNEGRVSTKEISDRLKVRYLSFISFSKSYSMYKVLGNFFNAFFFNSILVMLLVCIASKILLSLIHAIFEF